MICSGKDCSNAWAATAALGSNSDLDCHSDLRQEWIPQQHIESGRVRKVECDEVTTAMITELQDAVNPSGIRVLGVRLNDLTYAPEIAQAMLMRQQALALIDARKTIVEGGVEIVRDAVGQLADAGMEMSKSQTEQLMSNLLVVICSGERAAPVVTVQATQAV